MAPWINSELLILTSSPFKKVIAFGPGSQIALIKLNNSLEVWFQFIISSPSDRREQ